MENYDNYFEANKSLWNNKTAIHKNSEFYRLNDFKRGETVLTPIELQELGDVKGKTLLHLQCHFGMDTLDWQRRGALCTGVDFSDEAIRQAKLLAEELKLESEFICSNIYDLKDNLKSEFDIVFTSYGTIGWLPDLNKWAEIVSHFLKPGGVFYIVDFHPFIWMYNNDFTGIEYSYFNKEVIADELAGTYADREADIKQKEYGWNHSISEILTALQNNGLTFGFFHEFDFSPYNCFDYLVEVEAGKWQIKNLEGEIPIVYSLKMIK